MTPVIWERSCICYRACPGYDSRKGRPWGGVCIQYFPSRSHGSWFGSPKSLSLLIPIAWEQDGMVIPALRFTSDTQSPCYPDTRILHWLPATGSLMAALLQDLPAWFPLAGSLHLQQSSNLTILWWLLWWRIGKYYYYMQLVATSYLDYHW